MQSDNDSQELGYQRVTAEVHHYDHCARTQHPFSSRVDPKQRGDRRPSFSVGDGVRITPNCSNMHHRRSAD